VLKYFYGNKRFMNLTCKPLKMERSTVFKQYYKHDRAGWVRLFYSRCLKVTMRINAVIFVVIISAMLFGACARKNEQQSQLKDVPISGVTDEGTAPGIVSPPPSSVISPYCDLTGIVAERPPTIDSGLAEINIGLINIDSGKATALNALPAITEDGDEFVATGDVWQAEFPGGVDAWIKFLRNNIHDDIPANNNAPTGSYTVVVSFIIDEMGNITNVTAETNPGYGMAEEAVRVISTSPKWQPAPGNNHSVNYRQRQSIIFEVSEE
jgi:protein TonB